MLRTSNVKRILSISELDYSLIDKIRKVPGLGGLQRLNTIKIPRLAKGGIINLPGRGVPVGSAIGGERGQEGVIPLTDSQQMALLGEAIGKYIREYIKTKKKNCSNLNKEINELTELLVQFSSETKGKEYKKVGR